MSLKHSKVPKWQAIQAWAMEQESSRRTKFVSTRFAAKDKTSKFQFSNELIISFITQICGYHRHDLSDSRSGRECKLFVPPYHGKTYFKLLSICLVIKFGTFDTWWCFAKSAVGTSSKHFEVNRRKTVLPDCQINLVDFFSTAPIFSRSHRFFLDESTFLDGFLIPVMVIWETWATSSMFC